MSRLYKEIWRSYDSKTSLQVKLRLKNRPLSFATKLNENLQQALKLVDFPFCLSSVHFNDTKPPEFAPCKGIHGNQDSLGFWIQRHGFLIPGTGFKSWWKSDSGFQLLVRGRTPCAEFQIQIQIQNPGFRISQAKISWIPQSGFPYMWR